MMQDRGMIVCLLCFVCLVPLCADRAAGAADIETRGQLSGWLNERIHEGDTYIDLGLRYIPQLGIERVIGGDDLIGFDVSLNGYAFVGSDNPSGDNDLELYRLKFRFATSQTETRIGLQKINFGPAYLLRSLMWFDRVDPRDPQKLTEGVYALRFKYNAMNNAGLWLWGLYGNEETKGFEFLPSNDETPELGCRLQHPVPAGELAFTFHTREVDASNILAGDFRESRFAIDGRWDVEIGLWFESVLQTQRTEAIAHEWKKFITLGMDYTFALGNGLYCLLEHMAVVSSVNASGWDDDSHLSACFVNYPVGYLDVLSAICYYSWDDGKYSQFIAWQRTWDDLIIHLSAFHYPEFDVEPIARGAPGSGYGGRLTVIFNH